MISNISFSDESLLDIKEIRNYYADISQRVMQNFDKEYLQLNPDHFQKRYRNIKIVFIKKFPFGIHYIFEKNTIYIQRVLHQKKFYK